MSAPEAARRETYAPPSFAPTARPSRATSTRGGALASLSWAGLASTLHRVRRGEGALLAVNLSLIVYQGAGLSRGMAQALVSLLAIGLMYAFNDLYDAPRDWRNPKKDRALIAAYVAHRRAGALGILVLSLLTVSVAVAILDVRAAGAVAGVMLVNLVYSTALKGVPVVDVAWCGLWGALYAAIVGAPIPLLVVVGLMTAVCHLFQTLDDRGPDAAVGITTTAVRSPALARNVLIALCLGLAVAAHAMVGPLIALSALSPLAFFLAAGRPATGWLLTKGYFGALWLCLLGMLPGAAG